MSKKGVAQDKTITKEKGIIKEKHRGKAIKEQGGTFPEKKIKRLSCVL